MAMLNILLNVSVTKRRRSILPSWTLGAGPCINVPASDTLTLASARLAVILGSLTTGMCHKKYISSPTNNNIQWWLLGTTWYSSVMSPLSYVLLSSNDDLTFKIFTKCQMLYDKALISFTNHREFYKWCWESGAHISPGHDSCQCLELCKLWGIPYFETGNF